MIKRTIVRRIAEHAATTHAIETNDTIEIGTTIITIDNTMIAMCTLNTTIKKSAKLATIMTRITQTVTIASTTITSIIKTTYSKTLCLPIPKWNLAQAHYDR